MKAALRLALLVLPWTLLAAAVILGYRYPPLTIPVERAELDLAELIEASSLIVVAKPDAIARPLAAIPAKLGWLPYPTKFTPEYITADVQTVLKGSSGAARIRFFRWSWDGRSETYGRHFSDSWQMGAPYLLFLSDNDGDLRLTTDTSSSCMRLYGFDRSGAEPTSDRGALAGRIGRLVVNPEEIVDVELFTQELSSNKFTIAHLIGLNRTARLLENLLTHPSDSVRDAACVALNDGRFDGRFSCLEAIHTTNEKLTSTVAGTRWWERRQESSLRESLNAGLPSTYWVSNTGLGDDFWHVCDALFMLSWHEKPEIRKGICNVLQSEWPICFEYSGNQFGESSCGTSDSALRPAQ